MSIWPAEIAAWRNEHLRSSEHIAILRIAATEAFVLEHFCIEPDARDVPAEIRAFAFLSLIRPDATPAQAAKIDAEIERQLAALRKGAH
ncbi:hypothetical protein ACVCL3_01650 [Rhodanobacter sp. UC4437_H4]